MTADHKFNERPGHRVPKALVVIGLILVVATAGFLVGRGTKSEEGSFADQSSRLIDALSAADALVSVTKVASAGEPVASGITVLQPLTIAVEEVLFLGQVSNRHVVDDRATPPPEPPLDLAALEFIGVGDERVASRALAVPEEGLLLFINYRHPSLFPDLPSPWSVDMVASVGADGVSFQANGELGRLFDQQMNAVAERLGVSGADEVGTLVSWLKEIDAVRAGSDPGPITETWVAAVEDLVVTEDEQWRALEPDQRSFAPSDVPEDVAVDLVEIPVYVKVVDPSSMVGTALQTRNSVGIGDILPLELGSGHLPTFALPEDAFSVVALAGSGGTWDFSEVVAEVPADEWNTGSVGIFLVANADGLEVSIMPLDEFQAAVAEDAASTTDSP